MRARDLGLDRVAAGDGEAVVGEVPLEEAPRALLRLCDQKRCLHDRDARAASRPRQDVL